ncbi:hypothetical protein L202_08105 [Cryptococcus amylolentus CBS 6039]|uniref:Uncharacterized protein n=1 Tax=Cryptococcus amylolentus CBS 6039 TaxID=1295533 RepID=A0A1E3HB83_9TREE|nr:hypothetical protein L202_08105 [Cryptococcus amylolentus CBS 6039]ODN73602.1 hypothetical protein L202_08105 [Cryptococcus amylolentus CBS 6039]
MIKFLGASRKSIQHPPHKPAPHPCAPSEIKDSFPTFLSKLQSSSSSPSSPSSSSSSSSSSPQSSTPTPFKDTGFKPSGKPNDFENFWEAPGYAVDCGDDRRCPVEEMEAVRSFYRFCTWLWARWAQEGSGGQGRQERERDCGVVWAAGGGDGSGGATDIRDGA